MEKKFSFPVVSGLAFLLENLFAIVNVRACEDANVSVVVSGDEDLIKDIDVVQSSPASISVKGKGGSGGIITVINNGRGSSVSVSNISGNSISISNSVVMVDGKVIAPGNSDNVKTKEMTSIKVLMPKGSAISLSDVHKAFISGVGGKLNARLSGQGELDVLDVGNAKVKGSGQTQCDLKNVSGSVNLDVSGQSHVSAQGEFGDVEAEASGMSTITIIGNCQDVDAEASGMSNIVVRGQVSGTVRERKSGMSKISIC